MRTGALPAALPNVAPASLWPLTTLLHLPRCAAQYRTRSRHRQHLPLLLHRDGHLPLLRPRLQVEHRVQPARHRTAQTHALDSQTRGSNTHPRFAEPHSAQAPPAALQSAERPLLARSAPRLERLLLIRVALPLDSFWEARGHAGSVCHALRGLMRSLLFATHVTPGRDTPAVYAVQRYWLGLGVVALTLTATSNPDPEPDPNRSPKQVQRYCNAFFALMLQDYP